MRDVLGKMREIHQNAGFPYDILFFAGVDHRQGEVGNLFLKIYQKMQMRDVLAKMREIPQNAGFP